jgi:hypothetical protein
MGRQVIPQAWHRYRVQRQGGHGGCAERSIGTLAHSFKRETERKKGRKKERKKERTG